MATYASSGLTVKLTIGLIILIISQIGECKRHNLLSVEVTIATTPSTSPSNRLASPLPNLRLKPSDRLNPPPPSSSPSPSRPITPSSSIPPKLPLTPPIVVPPILSPSILPLTPSQVAPSQTSLPPLPVDVPPPIPIVVPSQAPTTVATTPLSSPSPPPNLAPSHIANPPLLAPSLAPTIAPSQVPSHVVNPPMSLSSPAPIVAPSPAPSPVVVPPPTTAPFEPPSPVVVTPPTISPSQTPSPLATPPSLPSPPSPPSPSPIVSPSQSPSSVDVLPPIVAPSQMSSPIATPLSPPSPPPILTPSQPPSPKATPFSPSSPHIAPSKARTNMSPPPDLAIPPPPPLSKPPSNQISPPPPLKSSPSTPFSPPQVSLPPFSRPFVSLPNRPSSPSSHPRIGSSDISKLQVGFYEGKCSNKTVDVEALIATKVEEHFRNNTSILPALLRLQFHDCFVHGCDASILIEGNSTERNASANLSVRGYEFIEALKVVVEDDCPGIVSCADIIAIATKVVVKLGGGPDYVVQTGRRDGLVSKAEDVDLPSPTLTVFQTIAVFKAKNFTAEEMVVLLGCHAVGITHCSFFQNRLYPDTNQFDPNVDPDLREELKITCPHGTNSNIPTLLNQNPMNTSKLDNSFYTQILEQRGILPIDQALARDPLTHGTVLRLSLNATLFNVTLANAMVKLQAVDVLTADQGEIRNVCSKFN